MRDSQRNASYIRKNGSRGRRAARVPYFEWLESRLLMAATPVGVNLDGLADYSTSYMFVDAMKTARTFGSANSPWDTAAPVDANGWPIQDAGSCVITLPQQYSPLQQMPHIDGVYHFSATGRVQVGGVDSNLTVTNWAYDATTNKTTADINVAPGATRVYLSFKGAAGGAKDIKLIRPGYDANTTQVFTNEFLNSISNVQTIRLMDYLHTNNNPVVNWSDRAKATDALQTSAKGGAWEYAIDLANTAHKDLWINIPAKATDDYVTQLATLLKAKLDPSLHVYVEYSNEVWNGIFSQYGENYALAQSEVGADPSVLNYDGINNSYYFGWRRIAERIAQISGDFSKVYGQSAITTTIRPVLASQLDWTYQLRNQLDFLEHTYGDPSNYLYGVASAPYIGIGGLTNSSSLSTDQVFPALLDALDWTRGYVAQYTSLAAYYGMKHLFYEGGVELSGDTSLGSAKIAATYDPRMGGIINQFMTAAYSDGVDQVMYYGLSGSYSSSGIWGLTENLSNLTSPKFTAFNAFATAARPAVTAGVALPAVGATVTLAGGAFVADRTENRGTGGDAWSNWTPNSYDYTVNAVTAGKYDLTLTVGEFNTGSTVTVLVDGVAAGTMTLKNTGSQGIYDTTAAVSLGSLGAGLHTVRVQFNSGGFSLHSVNVTNVTAPTPPAPPAAPAAPTGLAATTTGESQIQLTWNGVPGATGYAIERSLNGQEWVQVGVAVAGVTAFTDRGLNPGTAYVYRVKAYVGESASTSSGTANAITAAPAPIPVPTPVSEATTSGPLVLQLPIAAPTPPATAAPIAVSVPDPAPVTVPAPETAAVAEPTAVSEAAPVAEAAPVSEPAPVMTPEPVVEPTPTPAPTPATPPATTVVPVVTGKTQVPLVLSAVLRSSGAVVLTWNNVEGESGYVVQRQRENGSWRTLAVVAQNGTTFRDTGASGQSSTYRVVAVDSRRTALVTSTSVSVKLKRRSGGGVTLSSLMGNAGR